MRACRLTSIHTSPERSLCFCEAGDRTELTAGVKRDRGHARQGFVAWLARAWRQAICAHLWSYAPTPLRSSGSTAVSRRQCARCGAESITYQNAMKTP